MAAFVQLPKIDLRELRILLAGRVGCKEQRGPQQPVARLREARTRFCLTGLVGAGNHPNEGSDRTSVAELAGVTEPAGDRRGRCALRTRAST